MRAGGVQRLLCRQVLQGGPCPPPTSSHLGRKTEPPPSSKSLLLPRAAPSLKIHKQDLEPSRANPHTPFLDARPSLRLRFLIKKIIILPWTGSGEDDSQGAEFLLGARPRRFPRASALGSQGHSKLHMSTVSRNSMLTP